MWSSTVGRFESEEEAFKEIPQPVRHTPLSIEEKIPWKVQSTAHWHGNGALPVMDEVKREAEHQRIELLIMRQAQPSEKLEHSPTDTNAILHVTC